MIRAFVAIEIDPTTVQNIAAAIVELTPRIAAVRWVAPSHFHLTLKFLGDIDEAQISPIAQALEQHLHPFPRCTINAKGLGVFPEVKRPRVLWVGLNSNRLIALAAKVETALAPLGFIPDKRGFKPHLTVGRWRQQIGSAVKLGEELERWQAQEFGESEVKQVILFQSILKPEGAEHRPLKVIALADKERLN